MSVYNNSFIEFKKIRDSLVTFINISFITFIISKWANN
jgi:hypothetical protein